MRQDKILKLLFLTYYLKYSFPPAIGATQIWLRFVLSNNSSMTLFSNNFALPIFSVVNSYQQKN